MRDAPRVARRPSGAAGVHAAVGVPIVDAADFNLVVVGDAAGSQQFAASEGVSLVDLQLLTVSDEQALRRRADCSGCCHAGAGREIIVLEERVPDERRITRHINLVEFPIAHDEQGVVEAARLAVGAATVRAAACANPAGKSGARQQRRAFREIRRVLLEIAVTQTDIGRLADATPPIRIAERNCYHWRPTSQPASNDWSDGTRYWPPCATCSRWK